MPFSPADALRFTDIANQRLQAAHDALRQKLAPPKSVDPLARLPRELAEQIMGYLQFHQVITSCRVSKGWATFIRCTPTLWHHIDLSHARKKVKIAFISRAINIGRAKISKITLHDLLDFDKALKALIQHGTIEEVRLLNTGRHNHELANTLEHASHLKVLQIGAATHLSVNAIVHIAHNKSATLLSLQCDELSRTTGLYSHVQPPLAFPVLQRLDLRWTGDWMGLYDLLLHLDKLPNLQYLRFRQRKAIAPPNVGAVDLGNHGALLHLELCIPFTSACQLTLPSTLTHLSLSTTSLHAPGLPHLNGNLWLPHLQELHFEIPLMRISECAIFLQVPPGQSNSTTATEDTDLGGTSKESSLKALSLVNGSVPEINAAHVLSPHATTFLQPRLRALESLSLAGCFGVQDAWAAQIAEQLPGLKSLDLSRTRVTGVGIKDIVSQGNLKHLMVNECESISLDAIAWARSQGVVVENGKASMTGGKKVRW